MVSYIPDYGYTFRLSCLSCGVMLCAMDIPIKGKRDQVVPANVNPRPGIPTLHCKKCAKKAKERAKDFEIATRSKW